MSSSRVTITQSSAITFFQFNRATNNTGALDKARPKLKLTMLVRGRSVFHSFPLVVKKHPLSDRPRAKLPIPYPWPRLHRSQPADRTSKAAWWRKLSLLLMSSRGMPEISWFRCLICGKTYRHEMSGNYPSRNTQVAHCPPILDFPDRYQSRFLFGKAARVVRH